MSWPLVQFVGRIFVRPMQRRHSWRKLSDNSTKIRIVPEFINNIRDDTDKKLIKELCRASFTLGIGRKWYACLGSHLELEQLSQVPLALDISYSDNQGRHKETTTIDLKQYFWSLIYDSPMVDANVELKKMAKSLQSIDRKTPKG